MVNKVKIASVSEKPREIAKKTADIAKIAPVSERPLETAKNLVKLANKLEKMTSMPSKAADETVNSVPEETRIEAKKLAYHESLARIPEKRARTAKKMATAVESACDLGSATAESRAAWVLEQNTKNGR